MRVLCLNPTGLPLTAGALPPGLLPEPITEKSLLAGAQALRENRLLPVLLVARSQDPSDVAALTALLRRLRASGFQGAALVLGAGPSTAPGYLDAGADDALPCPAAPAELLSRLKAVLRRMHGLSHSDLRLGPLTFHLDGRHPEVAGSPVAISRREYEILQYLALNAGRVVSKSAIYDALYSLSADPPFEKIIDVYICRLRTKTGRFLPPGETLIETVAGRGYRLPPPLSQQAMERVPEAAA